MTTVAQQVHILEELAALVEAPGDVQRKAEAILEYYGRNRDLGWSASEALQRAIVKAHLCDYKGAT